MRITEDAMEVPMMNGTPSLGDALAGGYNNSSITNLQILSDKMEQLRKRTIAFAGLATRGDVDAIRRLFTPIFPC
jgi:hypothetical protein